MIHYCRLIIKSFIFEWHGFKCSARSFCKHFFLLKYLLITEPKRYSLCRNIEEESSVGAETSNGDNLSNGKIPSVEKVEGVAAELEAVRTSNHIFFYETWDSTHWPFKNDIIFVYSAR